MDVKIPICLECGADLPRRGGSCRVCAGTRADARPVRRLDTEVPTAPTPTQLDVTRATDDASQVNRRTFATVGAIVLIAISTVVVGSLFSGDDTRTTLVAHDRAVVQPISSAPAPPDSDDPTTVPVAATGSAARVDPTPPVADEGTTVPTPIDTVPDAAADALPGAIDAAPTADTTPIDPGAPGSDSRPSRRRRDPGGPGSSSPNADPPMAFEEPGQPGAPAGEPIVDDPSPATPPTSPTAPPSAPPAPPAPPTTVRPPTTTTPVTTTPATTTTTTTPPPPPTTTTDPPTTTTDPPTTTTDPPTTSPPPTTDPPPDPAP